MVMRRAEVFREKGFAAAASQQLYGPLNFEKNRMQH